MLMISQFVFMFLSLISLSNSACIDQNAIKGLGFSTALTAPEVKSDTSYCKGLYDKGGACVQESDAEVVLTNAKWGIKLYMDMQWTVINMFSDFQTDNQLIQMGIDIMKNAIKASGVNEESMNKCSKVMQIFKFGSLCYLSSGNASEKTTINGNNITFEVLESEGKQKEDCLDYLTKMCGLFTQFDMFDEEDQEAAEQCKGFESIPQCNGDDCSARYEKINEFLNTSEIPYSNEQIYNATMDQIKQQLEEVKKQMENGTNVTGLSGLKSMGRRLQTQATYKYKMKFTASGTAVVSNGEDSGVESDGLKILNLFIAFMTLIFV